MIKQRLIYAALIGTLLSGCSMVPDYNRPATTIPTGWGEAEATSATTIARDWWKNFNSAELDKMMAYALANNNDLNAAVARVKQARALSRIAGAPLYPSIDASAATGYDRINGGNSRQINTSDGEQSGSAGLSASYELDIFGGNRANLTAAEADEDSVAYDRDAVALTLMGDVAKNYFDVLNLKERMRIADENLRSATELLRIVQARFDAGATTALDVSQQKSDLASTEADRTTIEQNLKASQTALAVLLGTPPQNLTVVAENLDGMSVPDIAPGQPSSLLERRPDIRSAEQALIASNADIGVARAAFFPKIVIGVDAGIAATPIGDPATKTISLLSSLTAPIFKGGLLQGNLDLSKARKEELVENYRKTILVSFKDVEDSLSAVKASQSRETSLKTAMDEARKAYDLSRQQYDVGTIDFQLLLDARQTMLFAEDNYIQTRNDRLASAVDLYKALGGGWSDKMTSPRTNVVIGTSVDRQQTLPPVQPVVTKTSPVSTATE